MQVNNTVNCKSFPCADIRQEGYIVPSLSIDPSLISMIMISEASPLNPNDFYHAAGNPLFAQTTVQAFKDAGTRVQSLDDIIKLGVYLTTAVKCGKVGYGISIATIKQCSLLLERELALFPHVKTYLLMGDVAIKAINYVATRSGEKRVIPSGSTYKIRGNKYYFRDIRVFPSYLQAGLSFFIEKSKRRMIAEDIAAAMLLITPIPS